jgi:hypothetical protein
MSSKGRRSQKKQKLGGQITVNLYELDTGTLQHVRIEPCFQALLSTTIDGSNNSGTGSGEAGRAAAGGNHAVVAALPATCYTPANHVHFSTTA